MKGISAIIATLLLLVITMGLAVTAYFYINNLVTSRTNKVLNVMSGYCANGGIVLVLANEGTDSITANDIRIVLTNSSGTWTQFSFTFNPPLPLAPRATTVATYGSGLTGTQTLTVVTPSGTSKETVIC